MFKRMVIMLLLCGLVLGGVFGFKMFGKKMMMQAMASMSNPPQTVSTMKAASSDWQSEMKAVGTLRAVKGTSLSSEVSGIVENIFVESGQDVEEGTLLVQLRSVDDQARLDALEADLRLAELTVERDEKQIKVQAISQATFDADKAKLESLKAQVAEQKALLEKKSILAPFAGRLGLRQIDIGQFLNAGATMFPLQQLDPIYLDFSLPQQELPKIAIGMKVEVRTDAFPDKTFEGEIQAVDSKVDEDTRNIAVRAVLSNPEKNLRPGMFATASIRTGDPQKFLTLPQTAVTFNPYGSVVFVVEEKDGKAVARSVFVKTGATRGDQIAVLSGIKDGDEVVTAGQLKLRNGSVVNVNNSVQPINDPDPKPKDE